MIDSFKKAWIYLDSTNKRLAVWVFLTMLLMPFIELFGIGAVYSFVQMVANPEALHSARFFQLLTEVISFDNDQQALLFIGLGTLIAVLVRIFASLFSIWIRALFVRSVNILLSYRILSGYVSKPASFFAGTNTATLNKNILTETSTLSNGTIKGAMTLLSDALNIFIIAVGLVYIQPVITAIAILLFGGLYGSLSIILRKISLRLGEERLAQSDLRFRAANHVLGGIREIKILGRERVFLDKFKSASNNFFRTQMNTNLIASFPRYLLEAIVFSAVIAMVLVLVNRGETNGTVISLVSLYGLAAYRLMPSLDSFFKQITIIRSCAAAANELDGVLKEGIAAEAAPPPSTDRLSFQHQLQLKNVNFSYSKDGGVDTLKNINLTLDSHKTIAFVGSSGAGKSTLVKLIMGELPLTSGDMLVDGVSISPENVRLWQNCIGYVPQDIFLSDDTVSHNIAFGIREQMVDDDAVVKAARYAHLHDFIVKETPEGYATVVGERGVRISGGQRQRIGIARALYHEPSVLILDEATSALDTITEQAVADAIHDLNKKKTIIIIAHRLSTVRNCDVIYMLSEGAVVDSGTYDELLERNDTFRRMAKEET